MNGKIESQFDEIKLHQENNNVTKDGDCDYDKFKEKTSWTLEEGIEHIEQVVKLFFNNKFSDAKQVCANHASQSLYHSLALSYINFIYAIFTMESDLMAEAVSVVDSTLVMVDKMRKRNGLSGLFFRKNYNNYTDEECQAELIYGELTFMSFALTLISDPSLFTVVKAALKLRNTYNTYSTCHSMMNEKTNWKSEKLKSSYTAGTKLGYGFINVFISHLPTRVLKLLTFIGFTSDRKDGLIHLHDVTDNYKSDYRNKVTCFLVCLYSFYVEQFFGVGSCDLHWVKQITDDALNDYPNGAFDLFWSARADQLKGKANDAIIKFNACINSQSEFLAMHNVCNWDMLWSYALTCDWQHALECATKLEANCNWSKATNQYQKACFVYMIMEEQNKPELIHTVREYMRQVPELKKKFAGKTIPPEKFAITKANSFLNGDEEMVIPALELLYIWNIYGNSAENPGVLDPLLERIENKLNQFRNKSEKYFIPLLLKGVCLRNAKRGPEAIECFFEILQKEESIVDQKYIPPQACFELGMTYMDMHLYTEARDWLLKARDSYSGFLVESLVHLRIHGAMAQLKSMQELKKRRSSTISMVRKLSKGSLRGMSTQKD